MTEGPGGHGQTRLGTPEVTRTLGHKGQGRSELSQSLTRGSCTDKTNLQTGLETEHKIVHEKFYVNYRLKYYFLLYWVK